LPEDLMVSIISQMTRMIYSLKGSWSSMWSIW
jgi:hypothetical protein